MGGGTQKHRWREREMNGKKTEMLFNLAAANMLTTALLQSCRKTSLIDRVLRLHSVPNGCSQTLSKGK